MSPSSHKIELDHLQRKAYIYIRQSSPQQVLHNRESQRRQYGLKERALALGWPASAVVELDEDQAQTASQGERSGFQRLLRGVSQDEIGAIFNLEVSRLARQNSAWALLMELCRFQDVLLIDDQNIYDPSLPDDRLLLGIRGLLAETELDILHHRLQRSREAKAERGALRFRPPTGLVHDSRGRLCIDPDEEVQGAVRLLFTQFQRLGTAMAVVRYFDTKTLLFPTRHYGGARDGEVEWKPLTYGRALQGLHNPLYAGVYAYGRRAYSAARKPRAKRQQREVTLPPEEWLALKWDAFPGYISREEYEANQRQLAANQPKSGQGGTPRAGAALLSKRVLCGLCGRPMYVEYSGTDGRYVTYVCRPWLQSGQGRACQRVPGGPVDESVVQAVLEALTPAAIDLSLQVLDEVAQQQEALHQQWERRLERARYAADLARRRYQQVDPENRLVARTLEREWEECLAALVETEQAYQTARQQAPLTLGAAERENLLALARDLPALWQADSTTTAERKEVLRILMADVTLTRRDADILVQLRWVTNLVDTWTAPLPQRGARTNPVVLERIRELAPINTDAEIAARLNQDQLRTARGKTFTTARVAGLRRTHRIVKVRQSD